MKYNIQANESLTKVKEKWSTIKFDVFRIRISKTKSIRKNLRA